MTYLVSTGLVCLALAASTVTYLLHQPTIEALRDLGLPNFLRLQLAVLKILAIVVLAVPQFPLPAKEWAYAGVAFFLITSIVAHHVHGDHWALGLINLLFIAILLTSRLTLPA